jgi:hypothetical protein
MSEEAQEPHREKLEPIVVFLEPSRLKRLETIANVRRCKTSAVIREAVEFWLWKQDVNEYQKDLERMIHAEEVKKA